MRKERKKAEKGASAPHPLSSHGRGRIPATFFLLARRAKLVVGLSIWLLWRRLVLGLPPSVCPRVLGVPI